MKGSEILDIEIIECETIGSTQTHAKELLKNYKKTAPFCVIAKSQTCGYGQAGRPYYCPSGGLYMSLVLTEKDFRYEFGTGFAATCVADIISQKSDARRLSIKWVNDINLDGKKVGGVLIETVTTNRKLQGYSNSFDSHTQKYSIIGIGINLKQTEQIPDELKEKMGFINTTIPPVEFAKKIIKKITSEKQTDEQVLAGYKKYCNIDGLSIDGSLEITVDGKKIKKFNNLY